MMLSPLSLNQNIAVVLLYAGEMCFWAGEEGGGGFSDEHVEGADLFKFHGQQCTIGERAECQQ